MSSTNLSELLDEQGSTRWRDAHGYIRIRPAEWQAIRAVLEAADPEPAVCCGGCGEVCEDCPYFDDLCAWRNRQDLKARLKEALS